jgi:predicted O-linked N-acetylglucosamine transferase (SPINDLY family)
MAQVLQSQLADLPADDALPQTDSTTPDAACAEAMNLQIAGKLDLAAQLYRRVLHARPQHPMANYCVGMLYVQMQRAADGLPHLLTALQADPKIPDYWLGYLEALLLADRTAEAQSTLALGRQRGLESPAVEDFAKRLEARLRSRAVAPAPATEVAPAPRADRRRELRAAAQSERALLATLEQGNLAETLRSARTLTERLPERGLPWKILGALLWANGASAEALTAMQTAARLLPRDAENHANLGISLSSLERFDEAETCLRRAVEIDPRFSAAHGHLGNLYGMQGRYAEAEACLRHALALQPDEFKDGEDMRRTRLLFILSHNPSVDADSLFAEHCRVGAHLGGRLRDSWPEHGNAADPNRRLKIGLVSGDLRQHAVATFIEPVLEQLRDRPGLELHGYYNYASEDKVTERLRGNFESWYRIFTFSDAQVARKIMDDGIDILLDLSGHTAFNRLRALARKPAPIQVSWIGYPGTTGLRAMDYYFVDRHFLPPGLFDRHFTEKLVYLPAGAPFQPHPSAPPINALPALAEGHLSFGSFNRMSKLNASTIGLWSALLRALPNARMVIGGMPPNGQHGTLIDRFAAEGIVRERLTFHTRGDMDAYLALHLSRFLDGSAHVDRSRDDSGGAPGRGSHGATGARWLHRGERRRLRRQGPVLGKASVRACGSTRRIAHTLAAGAGTPAPSRRLRTRARTAANVGALVRQITGGILRDHR